MSSTHWGRLLRPATLTALGTLGLASVFVPSTLTLPAISALLPGAMLATLALLAVLLLISDQRQAQQGQASEVISQSPKRVLGAFALILAYALCVDGLGFYPSTAVAVPLIAFAFGYRQLRGLAIATVVVTGGIYLIFSYAMAQEFPLGHWLTN